MKLEYYQLTSIGNRKINQDYMQYDVNDRYALFVVADGLGGHHAGEKASRFFCKGLVGLAPIFSQNIAENPEQVMFNWIDATIDKMKAAFGDDASGIDAHTTCAILFMQKDLLVVAHCGDSRVYRLKNGVQLWRTRDHSITQNLLEDGALTEQQMGVHPEQNVLTRSINILKPYKPEIKVYPPAEKGEVFILCSDGFWEFTKEAEFRRLAMPNVSKKDLLKQAQLAMFRARGRSDNITVQWLRICE